MAGGAFLCLEGYHKVMDLVHPGHGAKKGNHVFRADAGRVGERAGRQRDPHGFHSLGGDHGHHPRHRHGFSVWVQAVVLGVVGAGMTLVVYGAVAVIV